MSYRTFCARFVFPVTGPLVRDGFVTIDDGRIVAVGARDQMTATGGEVFDLGNAAILPGLVNAHVHLDFSDLSSPLGDHQIHLPEWIRLVLEHRQATPIKYSERIALGLQESVRCGVTTLGEIAQAGWPVEQQAGFPVGGMLFQELIALTPSRIADAKELADACLRADIGSSERWGKGLSPHAPYSTHPDLLADVVARSAAQGVLVAMHLAESCEELELLRDGTGPMRTFLEDCGAWDASAFHQGAAPLDYLQMLAKAHRSLIIHGNYLTHEEIAFVAAHAARMAVVYCPRTHHWFAHSQYPLQEMVAAGVTVALGTDGRGSSPDLNLLSEMRFAARQHPTVRLDTILEMGTILGAKALGCEREVGSIEPGKRANLTFVALPDRDSPDPHELVLESQEPVIGAYFNGKASKEAG